MSASGTQPLITSWSASQERRKYGGRNISERDEDMEGKVSEGKGQGKAGRNKAADSGLDEKNVSGMLFHALKEQVRECVDRYNVCLVIQVGITIEVICPFIHIPCKPRTKMRS